jgi:hypothetical protein
VLKIVEIFDGKIKKYNKHPKSGYPNTGNI